MTAALSTAADEWLFGWDDTPGIVSVWADRGGRSLVWQRDGEQLRCVEDRFRPWLLAATLDDLAHLGGGLAVAPLSGNDRTVISYRELEGSGEGYRYLLSARDGRSLERALLTGASRRLGRRVGGLYDLGEAYYRVGPVEQYLMSSGRVYFRGMAYSDLHRLQFDLETTALDPQRGRIFLIAVRDSRGFATTLEAPTSDDEARLLHNLCALIRERNPDIIENHNLAGFDLPFLCARADALNVPLVLGRRGGPALLERIPEPGQRDGDRQRFRYSVAGRELIDTLDAVRRHDFVARDLPSHRLKDVARHFGLASEERVYLDGAAIYATYQRDPSTVRRYALDDVEEVDGLSQRLMSAPFALAQMAPRRYERVAWAGPAMGILEPMLVRAYLRAGAAVPCQAIGADGIDGPHAGGGLHLFATGVAEHVVKADIASLYPSLMRAYSIGPACDRLGVLLHIVDRLTDLRLDHKAAAREAAPGSLESGHHLAMQAAMKLIINAAYGYMGAGSMALFADRRAADEVTRRGREVLDQVVASVRERGVALVEADTDGVYFAVPSGWSEAQERALVADVGGLLPAGVRLEYEGRYQAMFSHEVKNYALLTYSGELIVRGVAMRSSRAEPFGERFLRQALLCTLRGDVAGVRAAFEATVTALHERTLPASDVAARVRLSKPPAAYLAARTTHREAAYEALLAAGRSQWQPGERVRFYRTQTGGHVWLPDETTETHSTSWEHDAPDQSQHAALDDARDYHADQYLQTLVTSYAARLRKAFAPEDFAQLFRLDAQVSLFDQPVETIQPLWIRCQAPGE